MPSVSGLLFLVAVLGAVATGSRMVSADGDPGRHLAVGEYILRSGSIPRADVFSHTMAGAPFVPYEWLAEVASALSYRLAGLAGPVLLHGTAIGLAFALLFGQLRRRGQPLLLALPVTALVMVVSGIHWLARPHVFTFLGTAIFATVLDGWYIGRLSRRWLWALPVVTAVWANLHGGFLVGYLFLAAYGAADLVRWLAGGEGVSGTARARLRAVAPVTLVCAVAPLANPVGAGLVPHVMGYFGNHLLVNLTQEYMSPDFHDKSLWPFAFLLLGTAAALGWSRRRPALQEVALFFGFGFVALHSVRNVPLFAIAVAPLLAAELAALPLPVESSAWASRLARGVGAFLSKRERRYAAVDTAAHPWALPAMVTASLLLLASVQQRDGVLPLGVRFDPAKLPVAAAAFLKASPAAGNGFNELGWGGYLLHELWPAQRVFIDGQTDFYGEPLTREYLVVQQLGTGWQDVLARHDVGWAIVPADSLLARRLPALPEWRVTYSDQMATVIERVERR